MNDATDAGKTEATRRPRPFKLIGELMNHSFARARRAWANRDVAAYQKLAGQKEAWLMPNTGHGSASEYVDKEGVWLRQLLASPKVQA